MTERLYYQNSYTTEFQARVVAIEDAGDSEPGSRVGLDSTYFYPTSGGQMHDRGRIGGVEVVDVYDEGDEIWHQLSSTPDFAVGELVEASIDAVRRAHHRQQHTGQHVLSSVLFSDYDLVTQSSRLGESGNTLDVAGELLQAADLDRLEQRCLEVFWQAHPVHIHLLTGEEAAQRGLRKQSRRSGPIRVIEVEGVDLCPCGGTHVDNTAEIGMIALSGLERVSGGQRIHFLCGSRAAAARREATRTLYAMAADLTTGVDQLADSIRRLKTEVKELESSRQRIAQEVVRARVPQWRGAAREATVQGHHVRWVHRDLDEVEALAANQALREVTDAAATLATFTLVENGRGQLLVACSAELDLDCPALLREVLEPLCGKGGGRKDHARGGFRDASVEDVRAGLSNCIETSPA